MRDRAYQALVKQALEPEWEARFEATRYGFRPGRGCHDAIGAIFNESRSKEKYVLDADIQGCFDGISHQALDAQTRHLSSAKTDHSGLAEGWSDGSWKADLDRERDAPRRGRHSSYTDVVSCQGGKKTFDFPQKDRFPLPSPEHLLWRTGACFNLLVSENGKTTLLRWRLRLKAR
jgi:hypothetical protein